MTNSGIYVIINKINNKVYIGKASNLDSRIRAHKSCLRRDIHYNTHLQRAWKKYGEENFLFKILENCNKNELILRENYWMNYYNSFDFNFGYNILSPSENNNSYIFPDEVKKTMSDKAIKYSDEELISYLQEFFYMNGKIPTVRDLKLEENYPSPDTYNLRFGSFKNALIEADLYTYVKNKKDFDRIKYNKSEIIESINKFILDNNNFPSRSDFDNNENLPSNSTFFRFFKTIEGAKIECRYDISVEKEREKEDMITALKELYKRDGYVTSRTIDKCDFTRSSKYYSKIFGTLMNAFKIAGVQSKRIYKVLEH